MGFYMNVFNEWRDARTARIDINAKIGLDMIPAADAWKLQVVESKPRTTVPIGDEEMQPQVLGPRDCTTFENMFMDTESYGFDRKDEDGVLIQLANHELFKQFGTSKGMDGFAKPFAKPAKQWAFGFEKVLESHMATLASSLASKVILPAGEIYEFKSLNTDEHGHVYSLLSYKTSTSVSQFGKAESD